LLDLVIAVPAACLVAIFRILKQGVELGVTADPGPDGRIEASEVPVPFGEKTHITIYYLVVKPGVGFQRLKVP
jgi:hypothetical protein